MSHDPESGLLFDDSRILPAPNPGPISKILGHLNNYLPGYFQAEGEGTRHGSIHFAHGLIDGMDKPIYLHARTSGEMPKLFETNSVSINGGICMFGKTGIIAFDQDNRATVFNRQGIEGQGKGSVVSGVEANETQIYVPEATARLGRTMVSLAKYAKRHDLDAEVTIQIPDTEYKVHAEAMYVLGKITLEALQQYYELVDHEAENIEERFAVIFDKNGMSEPTFLSDRSEGGGITPGSFFKSTPAEIDLLRGEKEIDKFLTLTYAASYLRASRMVELPIFVENYQEEGIFETIKQLPDFKGLALFPLPQCSSTHARDLVFHENASETEIVRAVSYWA